MKPDRMQAQMFVSENSALPSCEVRQEEKRWPFDPSLSSLLWNTWPLTSLPEQIAQKYDPQKEEELRIWIEETVGKSIGPDFQKGLKNGIILCE